MENFFNLTGFDRFYAISVWQQEPDDFRISVVSCKLYEISEVLSGKISPSNRDKLAKEIMQNYSDCPWVMCQKENTFFVLGEGSADQALLMQQEIWDVSELTGMFFPLLGDVSLPSLHRFYLQGEGSIDAALPVIFLRILEHLVRMPLKTVTTLGRLLEATPREELKKLFADAAAFAKDAPEVTFHYPRVTPPPAPSNVVGESANPVSSDTVEPVGRQMVEKIFAGGGYLNAHFDAYEEREEQIRLALEINEAFNQSNFILAEAGTGTGKSLAYLVPAALWTAKNKLFGESAVVSTHTKNLQDQLFYKDIPLLNQILPVNFRAVLLKGRSNYLCMKKWKEILNDPGSFLTPSEREKVVPLVFWSQQTQTGDISECTGFSFEENLALWHKLASESVYCQAQKCNSSEECFVKKIREESRKAHVTVVNHSLLFSDLVTENSILGDYPNLIIDEAHHLERTAQSYLGLEFSMWAVKNMLSTLYERDQFETGLFIRIRQKLKQSKLSAGESRQFMNLLTAASDTCGRWWAKTQTYLQRMTLDAYEWTNKQPGKEMYFTKHRYTLESSLLKKECNERTEFIEAAAEVSNQLAILVDTMKDWQSDVFEEADEMRQLLMLRLQEVATLMTTFEQLAKAEQKNFVYWCELPMREKSYDLRFYGVPLNIGDILQTVLFNKLHTCVFSSATLSVSGSFNYYKSRVGLESFPDTKLCEFSVGSPFNFEEQCLSLALAFMPDPTHASFSLHCNEVLSRIIRRYRRGALILFTSYAMMRDSYKQLKESLANDNITLLMQGRDGSRTALAERFRKDRTSVLLGTDSFWEGVDVPGDALELLVITKLPFEVPSDPLVAAKMERIERNGGKPFFDYSVPEAVIKFRQGFGRLIRSKTDRGVVLIMDNRVSTKGYGTTFTGSLPTSTYMMPNEKELTAALDEFFEKK
ncbi:DEAD/DEAH box helicase family protein [bacterium]|nr:DEAD/DEAH box helicase family protein [bacterium]